MLSNEEHNKMPVKQATNGFLCTEFASHRLKDHLMTARGGIWHNSVTVMFRLLKGWTIEDGYGII